MSEHAVGPVEEFPPGEGVGVDVDGLEMAVFNLDGEFYAIADRCSHKRAPLHRAGEPRVNQEACGGDTRGEVDPQDCTIQCPQHCLEWDLETGRNPATGDVLPTFDIRVVDGEVRVRL